MEAARAFRRGNEAIAKAARRTGVQRKISFICECEDYDCLAEVPLTLEEYEQTRNGTGRIVLAEHESSRTTSA